MSAPQRRRPGEARPTGRMTRAERRRQLLACAKPLLLHRGLPGTTTADFAAAAGVSEALFLRHFADHQAIVLAVIQDLRQATLEQWQQQLNGLTDPLARLHALTDYFLLASRELHLEFRIVQRTLTEASDEEVVAGLRAYFLECETLLAQIIAEGQQAGVCRRSLDPRVGAWELIHNVLGHALTLPLAVPLHQEDYLPRAAECLLQCLLKTDV